MAASARQDQGFTVGLAPVGERSGDRQPQHLALKLWLVHLGHQRNQGAVVHAGNHATTEMGPHQEIFAQRLDDARQAVEVQPRGVLQRPIREIRLEDAVQLSRLVGDAPARARQVIDAFEATLPAARRAALGYLSPPSRRPPRAAGV